MQESRTLVVMSTTTATGPGVFTDFVNIPRPATAATFLATVTSGSGTLTLVIQRGIRLAQPGDTTVGRAVTTTNNADILWFDYAAFTSTTTTGRRFLPLVYTSTVSDSRVTTTANMTANYQLGGSIGTLFRGAYNVTGASPTFTFDVVGEFEF